MDASVRWPVRLLAAASAMTVRLWMTTLRYHAHIVDGRQHPPDPSRERFIYAFWHEGLLAPLVVRAPVRVLVSRHADGELIAQVCRRLGIGLIRGSTNRGGVEALLQIAKSADDPSHLAITPDGPRGPRRELQAGLIMAASLLGQPIVPLGIGFTRAWRAGSWDRFAVPLPFSTLTGVVGEPITIPPGIDRSQRKHYQLHVQSRLEELTQAAQAWADRIRQDGRQAALPQVPPLAELRPAA